MILAVPQEARAVRQQGPRQAALVAVSARDVPPAYEEAPGAES